MKTTKIILLTILIGFGMNIIAQVAINTDGSSPDASALLDLKSSGMGMLVPRMTQAEIALIASPADGLLVYNTSDERFYFYDDGAGEWKEMAIGSGIITPTPPWSCGDALVDSRDSKSYTTVLIDAQCWMAENLNIGIRIDGENNQTDNSTIEKYCYDNNDANCTTYGGLYQWDEIMQYVTDEGIQGICPDGWHLPADTEWTTITNFLGGENIAGGKMKEIGTAHWNTPNTGATNSSGFTAVPGGLRQYDEQFVYIEQYGSWWSSSVQGGTIIWYRNMSYNHEQVGRGANSKMSGYSVRCLKD